MCAIFSRTVLKLTWWPLFRDCSFYSVALITLIFFFRDSYIYWWEALILFSIYICYVTFMRFNQIFERTIKKLLFKNRVTRVSSTDQLVNNVSFCIQNDFCSAFTDAPSLYVSRFLCATNLIYCSSPNIPSECADQNAEYAVYKKYTFITTNPTSLCVPARTPFNQPLK